MGTVNAVSGKTSRRQVLGWFGRYAVGAGGVVALIAGWEMLRQSPASFWVAGVDANNPGRIIRSNEVWPRFWGWLRWLRYFAGSVWLSTALGGLIIILPVLEFTHQRLSRRAALSLTQWAYAVVYLVFHWLVAFPLLDRYLLPLVPLWAMLLVRAGYILMTWLRLFLEKGRLTGGRNWAVGGIMAVLIAAMLPGAVAAGGSRIPVGGDHGQYDSIGEVAAYLAGLPDGSVVYDELLGWPLAWYLFDSYVYRAPYGSPAALEADLQTFAGDETVRVLVMPGWVSDTEVLAAVQQAGMTADPVLETSGRAEGPTFIVYRLRTRQH